MDRTILCPRDPPQPKFDHIEYKNTPILYKTPLDIVQATSEVVVLKISKEQLNLLKTKAKEDNGTDNFTTNYTTFEVLAAHVWKCTCLARGVPNNVEARLYFRLMEGTRG